MGCNCGTIILVSSYNLYSIRQRRFLAILNMSAKKRQIVDQNGKYN